MADEGSTLNIVRNTFIKGDKIMSWTRSWYCFFGTLLPAMVCLILAAPANMFAEEGVAANPEAPTVPCKGLKPYNNLDELLYQFYINLESDCLFTMPLEELEKIWGVKILTEERFKPQNYYPLAETDFYFKPYKSEKDAFYIELAQHEVVTMPHYIKLNATIFKIKITQEYLKMHGTLFPDQKMPKLLPKPITSYDAAGSLPCIFPQFDRSENNGPKCAYPGWSNSMHTQSLGLNDEHEIWFYVNWFIDRTGSEKVSENLSAEVLTEAAANATDAPCRGLKPINDIDGLLYQFYINFDSDCLFTMPIDELENIWGIKLYSREENKSHILKPYKSPKDAFYVVVAPKAENIKVNFFEIIMTEDYKKKHSTFFYNALFPIFIPLPEKKTIRYSPSSNGIYEEFQKQESEWIVMDNDTFVSPNYPKFDTGGSNLGCDNKIQYNDDLASFSEFQKQSMTFLRETNYNSLFNSNKTHEIIYYGTNILIR